MLATRCSARCLRPSYPPSVSICNSRRGTSGGPLRCTAPAELEYLVRPSIATLSWRLMYQTTQLTQMHETCSYYRQALLEERLLLHATGRVFQVGRFRCFAALVLGRGVH